MIFIQVDQEHCNDTPQYWHTPRLLNRNKMYKKKKSGILLEHYEAFTVTALLNCISFAKPL